MRTGDVQESGQPVDFFPQRFASVASEPIVAASLVDARRRCWRLLDPSVFHEPLQRAVDRSGSKAKPVARLALHVLENHVAVSIASREGEQHVYDGRGQR